MLRPPVSSRRASPGLAIVRGARLSRAAGRHGGACVSRGSCSCALPLRLPSRRCDSGGGLSLGRLTRWRRHCPAFPFRGPAVGLTASIPAPDPAPAFAPAHAPAPAPPSPLPAPAPRPRPPAHGLPRRERRRPGVQSARASPAPGPAPDPGAARGAAPGHGPALGQSWPPPCRPGGGRGGGRGGGCSARAPGQIRDH